MDLNMLLSLIVFALSLLGLGVWALFLTRRTSDQAQAEADRQLTLTRAEYAELTERIWMAEEVLRHAEQSPTLRVVVRNPTTGQFRGAYRRTLRTASLRAAAHQF